MKLVEEKLRKYEKITNITIGSPVELSGVVARILANKLKDNVAVGKKTVFGLATGNTPLGMYKEFIRIVREEEIDCSDIVSFNLDEYYPISPMARQSYHRFMVENLFKHLKRYGHREENANFLDGRLLNDNGKRRTAKDIQKHCDEYEKLITAVGGIDIQLLGIGRNGHIGFNEPYSPFNSKTRMVELTDSTRTDNCADFFGKDNMPRYALTIGIGTITKYSRRIILMATGEHKGHIINEVIEGRINLRVPASILQKFATKVEIYLDQGAAAELTRVIRPWLISEVDWSSNHMVNKAVISTAQSHEKPLIRLTTAAFRRAGLDGLNHYYQEQMFDVIQSVLERLKDRIYTSSVLPKENEIVVFSPHSDDDIISMGGTARKLKWNNNRVTNVYLVSGSLAVRDQKVLEYLTPVGEAVSEEVRSYVDRFYDRRVSIEEVAEGVKRSLSIKKPGDIDTEFIQNIKRIVREMEATYVNQKLGTEYRFLDLPFYKTGEIEKKPISEVDVMGVLGSLRELKPEIIFIPGELTDPHGTHGMCMEAIWKALDLYIRDSNYAQKPIRKIYAYKGAWQEYRIWEADVFVLLELHQMQTKINLIMDHNSQLNPLFPGPDDSREFWERARDRNIGTLNELRYLGLKIPDKYIAAEAFAEIPIPEVKSKG